MYLFAYVNYETNAENWLVWLMKKWYLSTGVGENRTTQIYKAVNKFPDGSEIEIAMRQ